MLLGQVERASVVLGVRTEGWCGVVRSGERASVVLGVRTEGWCGVVRSGGEG